MIRRRKTKSSKAAIKIGSKFAIEVDKHYCESADASDNICPVCKDFMQNIHLTLSELMLKYGHDEELIGKFWVALERGLYHNFNSEEKPTNPVDTFWGTVVQAVKSVIVEEGRKGDVEINSSLK